MPLDARNDPTENKGGKPAENASEAPTAGPVTSVSTVYRPIRSGGKFRSHDAEKFPANNWIDVVCSPA
jgi:hypothetical protein